MSVATDTGIKAKVHPSPNHGQRASGAPIDMVIVHYTGMETGRDALQRLCDPRSEVSAHYLIEEDGSILQCVPEARRAWHAGRSFWKGESDINSRSIGIEIVNPGHEFGYRAFPDVQIEAVIALLKDVCARHAIEPWMVLAHSDIAPDRKEDPGELFPWDRLAKAGIGHFVLPIPISGSSVMMQEGETGQPVEAVQSMLALYGYDIEITGDYDKRTRLVVTAFQRHFRPERVDGIADQSTIDTLYALLNSMPVFSPESGAS
ncbi:N-acetylmuramoyl-L-alanine amidase [Roseibium denhamense]|uniref:N-acetylmuramoyl-L-alanine amidase n=1 Tax=Roseibium denhamense TaxID=76305 RepID=A0ABY1NB60_9HYPH|nr:N-acetylmuramoyl-L-alanine amidase [Roseibium denhamense]MTI06583.1 N-acetylmuramoyl-L-alanine amidase [Roseibium denhamense]SMP05395.1 N-acetylmuramoyl-L-alanine amidase [Roseibium denhamense]